MTRNDGEPRAGRPRPQEKPTNERERTMKKEATKKVYVDALGREVPAAYVPKDKKEKDAAARKVLGWWVAEEKRLAKLWEETRKVVEKMHAGARKAEGLAPAAEEDGEAAGYYSFRSFDGKIVVERNMPKMVAFNDKIHLAKEELDAALREIAGETVGDLREIVAKAFAPRGRKKMLDRQRLHDICETNVRNEHWKKAVELIKAAEEVAGRVEYLGVIAEGRSVILDLHRAARAAGCAEENARTEGGAE